MLIIVTCWLLTTSLMGKPPKIITDWINQSSLLRKRIPWNWKVDRTRALRELDAKVAAFNNTSIKDYKNRIAILTEIVEETYEWEKEVNENRYSDRMVMVEALRKAALAEHELLEQKNEKDMEARQLVDVIKTFPPVLAQYVKSAWTDVGYFYHPKERVQALTAAREADGSLTDAVVRRLNDYDGHDIAQNQIQMAETSEVVSNVPIQSVKKFMDTNLNTVTGMTLYPELLNLIKPNNQPEAVRKDMVTVTSDITTRNVVVEIAYSPSDVNHHARIAQVTTALKKILDKGFFIPALRFYIPKYGRSLTIEEGDGNSVSVLIGQQCHRAVYIAPDFVLVSPGNFNNPIPKGPGGHKGPMKYWCSSTHFDPSGVGTIIHELGHALHFHNNPGFFHIQWATSFKTPQIKALALSVSKYASGNPREFVAEVFIGLIYGRKFSPEVMALYQALGGVMPNELDVKGGRNR
ncbi:MAG: hypothetical protein GY754_08815 [bacterium]|nr:hypothetical protein [bacterium]